jgi:hypothetical protein
MSHPPVFVSEPNLTPSDKKLGCAALYVCVCFAFASDSYAEGQKGQKRQKGLFVLRFPFKPFSASFCPLVSGAVINLSREAHHTFHFSPFSFQFKNKRPQRNRVSSE